MDITNEHNCLSTPHAMIYFNDRIARPIANYLKTTYVNGTPLSEIIRFIVLAKGIPHRIQTREEEYNSWGGRQNLPVDGLLCLLGETMENENALLEYLNWGDCFDETSFAYNISNPYYNEDLNFTESHYFLPNKFKTTANVLGQARDISLSYLVSHLTAPRYGDITAMIDRSIEAVNAEDYD